VNTRVDVDAGNGSITSLLTELSHGNKAVESDLAELVYRELHRLASIYMGRERGNHTLQPTALVNEVWTRLGAEQNVSWENRSHFFAIASNRMRQVLVDHARKRRAAKRGGAQKQITLHDCLLGEQHQLVDVLALNEALDRLKVLDSRASRIVELHFFGGIPFEEMALLFGVSARTVKRDWSMARAWLHIELAKQR
jgi:RNA polymerase sigma-70 factor, ECF subfamily